MSGAWWMSDKKKPNLPLLLQICDKWLKFTILGHTYTQYRIFIFNPGFVFSKRNRYHKSLIRFLQGTFSPETKLQLRNDTHIQKDDISICWKRYRLEHICFQLKKMFFLVGLKANSGCIFYTRGLDIGCIVAFVLDEVGHHEMVCFRRQLCCLPSYTRCQCCGSIGDCLRW